MPSLSSAAIRPPPPLLILFIAVHRVPTRYHVLLFVLFMCHHVMCHPWHPKLGGRDGGGGTIGFSPVDDDGAGGCVSWAAVLTLEAIHRVLASPSVVLELFR